ncbi:TetR/AcrR family transcriptional regulator [Streptomyces griseorubiginosus]|uniref:TetR/AcrR family transcriptional regulator n=1 Tax=Streptomyces griseorubiginosus TaxID=67304 RepID=UPI002E82245E|nr:TetR/AcrR family transcriptional regulator [Streptomyces griseorubiginosus]WUB46003.1 TetR/AcrR family transcriptional regulator [Streptomyces griseorubiginosus]WUB54523.1 TetR/AcrR family transcriptional regulator [Streptomyces griseorubiginosus]
MAPMPAEKPERPESRPYHHGDLRSALLAAAERTLRDKGSSASLSLRELARDIGVSHAAPGRHFKDKQALLDALALVGFDRMAEALEAADDPGLPLQDRLTTLARAYLRFAIDNPELLEVMYARKHEPDAAEQLTAAIDRTVGSLERAVAAAQQRGEIVEGDPEELTLVVGTALHGLASFAITGKFTTEAAMGAVAELIHHLMHGLRPR